MLLSSAASWAFQLHTHEIRKMGKFRLLFLFFVTVYILMLAIFMLIRYPSFTYRIGQGFTLYDDKLLSSDNALCTNIEWSSLTARTAVWQDVSADRSDILVYSAFWDSRLSSPTVLILGLKNLSYTEPFTCLLWYQHQHHPVATEAKVNQVVINKPVR